MCLSCMIEFNTKSIMTLLAIQRDIHSFVKLVPSECVRFIFDLDGLHTDSCLVALKCLKSSCGWVGGL